MPSSAQLKLASWNCFFSCCWSWKQLIIYWLGVIFTLAWAAYSVNCGWIRSRGLAELQHSARLVKDLILNYEQKLWIKVVWLVVNISCEKKIWTRVVNRKLRTRVVKTCWGRGCEQNLQQELWTRGVSKSLKQMLLSKVMNKRFE